MDCRWRDGKRAGGHTFHLSSYQAVKRFVRRLKESSPTPICRVELSSETLLRRGIDASLPLPSRIVNAKRQRRYLEGRFGEALPAVREAMRALAKAFKAVQLAQVAFRLYEEFRPGIPVGVAGWGAKGGTGL